MLKPFTLYKISCDGCGKHCPEDDDQFAAHDPEAMNEEAKEHGWVLVQDAHFCPACSVYLSAQGNA